MNHGNTPLGLGSSDGLGPWTCRDAMQLRKHLAINCAALLKTAPLVVEGVEDDDPAFALREIAHESQLRGLRGTSQSKAVFAGG